MFTACRVMVLWSTAVGLTLFLFIRNSCAFVVRKSFGYGYAALGPMSPISPMHEKILACVNCRILDSRGPEVIQRMDLDSRPG